MWTTLDITDAKADVLGLYTTTFRVHFPFLNFITVWNYTVFEIIWGWKFDFVWLRMNGWAWANLEYFLSLILGWSWRKYFNSNIWWRPLVGINNNDHYRIWWYHTEHRSWSGDKERSRCFVMDLDHVYVRGPLISFFSIVFGYIMFALPAGIIGTRFALKIRIVCHLVSVVAKSKIGVKFSN